MESSLFLADLLTGHEPGAGGRGAAFQGRGRLAPATERAALEGRAPDRRFMGSLDELAMANRDDELGRDALPRVLADRQVGPTRFMERAGVRGSLE